MSLHLPTAAQVSDIAGIVFALSVVTMFASIMIGALAEAQPSQVAKREAAEKAAARAANPPEIETFLLSDDKAKPFKIYGMHDRAVGIEQLLIVYKGKVTVVSRGRDGDWSMPGDPTRIDDRRPTVGLNDQPCSPDTIIVSRKCAP